MSGAVLSFQMIDTKDRAEVGGKGFNLAYMSKKGFPVPKGLCIGNSLYRSYLASTGLEELIYSELSRKSFEEMRWEEIWDASLRIRNFFLRTALPSDSMEELKQALLPVFGETPVVIRSSSISEDTANASFAGLHESYVNIRGIEKIIDHIKLVWASLWSDAALLYRKELGLDPSSSSMAVVVQELIEGEQSGVAFGQSPSSEHSAVIEAVWGLNEGLVSGDIEPDRWIISRETARVVDHIEALRDKKTVSAEEGTLLKKTTTRERGIPPLTDNKLSEVYSLLRKVENYLGHPPDIEWTFRKGKLYLLQARPITTSPPRAGSKKRAWDSKDKRPWYLTLTRSLENLSVLRKKIKEELLPRMDKEALELSMQKFQGLSDKELADEIARRIRIRDRWKDVYWSEFIPFAHGIRLFGQIYNNSVRPEDPYEFMDLLAAKDMKSVKRNIALEGLAEAVRSRLSIVGKLREGKHELLGKDVLSKIDKFIKNYGEISCGVSRCLIGREGIINLLIEMASAPPRNHVGEKKDTARLEKQFLELFNGEQKSRAIQILDIGRESYRLRDDDNLYFGKIQGELLRALEEGINRIDQRGIDVKPGLGETEVVKILRGEYLKPEGRAGKRKRKASLEARQLVGNPASPGIAIGKARVVDSPTSIFQMKSGEVLVVDAIEPNMTFSVPLASGIVERRGGMLIHGAIIAREYGIPCVTGIPRATERIRTGDKITVDGYLGIVRIKKKDSD